MPFTRHITSSVRNALKAGLLLLALLAPGWQLAAADAPAPAAPAAPKRQLTDKVIEALPAITKMITDDPRNYDGAVAAINALLPQVQPESFDNAVLLQMKAQALISKGDYVTSIPPLETSLSLSQRYHFFEKSGELSMQWMLVQLYVQDAQNEANSGKNPALLQQKYNRALTALRTWLSVTPKPTYEAYSIVASILFQQAMVDQNNPNKDLLRQSEEAAINALVLTPTPNESTYRLLVAIAQALGDNAKAARYLEILVKANPKSENYWRMLFNTYHVMIEATPKDSFLRNQAYAMAVYTINRAQQNGFMLTPQDYFNKVAMYINSDQLEGAADLLEASLHSGKIETNKYSNWDTLAQTYIQLDDPQKAIDTFHAAQKFFPDDGNIDMQIGYLYFGMQQYRPALEAMLAATQSGKVVPPKKAPELYSFIAYIYLYMKEYEKGMEAVQKSLSLNPANNNAQGIKRALEEAIEARNRILNHGIQRQEQQQQKEQKIEQKIEEKIEQKQEQKEQTQPATAAQPAP